MPLTAPIPRSQVPVPVDGAHVTTHILMRRAIERERLQLNPYQPA